MPHRDPDHPSALSANNISRRARTRRFRWCPLRIQQSWKRALLEPGDQPLWPLRKVHSPIQFARTRRLRPLLIEHSTLLSWHLQEYLSSQWGEIFASSHAQQRFRERVAHSWLQYPARPPALEAGGLKRLSEPGPPLRKPHCPPPQNAGGLRDPHNSTGRAHRRRRLPREP